ncbi:MAG TPA: hypothetical protein VKC66_25990, partial [Xanthobacteraceae bacterium]|nr:hypothetical protein [Xanthobacteraceae bacterium]
MKHQKSANQVDGKDAGNAIATELFGDPAARRSDELRPCDHNVCKRHWRDEHTRLADGTNYLICAFSGHTDRIVPGGTFSSQTNRIFFDCILCSQANCAFLDHFRGADPKSSRLCNGADAASNNGDVESGETNLLPRRQTLSSDQDRLDIFNTPEKEVLGSEEESPHWFPHCLAIDDLEFREHFVTSAFKVIDRDQADLFASDIVRL